MKGLPGQAKRDRGIYQTLKGYTQVIPGQKRGLYQNLNGLPGAAKADRGI